jgi:hypothetical protein
VRTLFVRLGQIGVVAAGLAIMMPTAQADSVTFTLNTSTASGNTCSSCGPFGTVTVTSDGTDMVKVTETLASKVGFVSTGAGDALSFNISGDPTITVGGLTTGFAQDSSGDSKGDTGTFDYGISCTVPTGCGNGGSNPNFGTLSFTVTTSGPLTPAEFELESDKGFYVASDVIDDNVSGDPTGNAESTEFTESPEPTTMLLFGTGLLAIASIVRRSTAKST